MNMISNQIYSFSELQSVIDSANHDISFWGWRHLYVREDGKEIKFSFEFINELITSLLRKNPEFSEDERSSGLSIRAKLIQFRTELPSLLKQKNIITRIFYWISIWFENVKLNWSGRQWEHPYSISDVFEYYSIAQIMVQGKCTKEEAEQSILQQHPPQWEHSSTFLSHRWQIVSEKNLISPSVKYRNKGRTK